MERDVKMLKKEYEKIIERMRSVENSKKYHHINMAIEKTENELLIWDINKKIQAEFDYLKKIKNSYEIERHEENIKGLINNLREYLEIDGWK